MNLWKWSDRGNRCNLTESDNSSAAGEPNWMIHKLTDGTVTVIQQRYSVINVTSRENNNNCISYTTQELESLIKNTNMLTPETTIKYNSVHLQLVGESLNYSYRNWESFL